MNPAPGHRSSITPSAIVYRSYMVRRGKLVVLFGVAALGMLSLVGCSSSAKKAATTTIARTTTTAALTTTTTTTSTSTPTTSSTLAASTVSSTTTTAAGRVVSSPSDSVHLGDSGSGVRQIQSALAAKGYGVSVDGKFGAQTDQAVKSFQAKNGLKQDGIVGPATWAKLQAKTSTTTAKTTSTTKA